MKLKRILLILIIAFVLIQFRQIDRTNPETDPKQDFLVMSNAPAEISEMIKTSCYDCHSNQVNYPWYTYVAPVSWAIDNHIQDGRKHLNFSEWGTYAEKRKNHKLEECVDELKADKMPLSSYILIHKNARLADTEKDALIAWLNTQIKPVTGEK